MNIVSSVVIFAVTWFLALYCLLPVRIKSQEEAGDDIPEGAMRGAPSNPNLRIKALGATVISLVITGTLYFLINAGILNLGLLDGVFGIPDS